MEYEELEKALIRKFTPWLAFFVIGGSGLAGSGVLRIDGFSGSDAKLMQAEILAHVDADNRVEEKECLAFRQDIYKRLNRLELYQDQIVALIHANGLSLKP